MQGECENLYKKKTKYFTKAEFDVTKLENLRTLA